MRPPQDHRDGRAKVIWRAALGALLAAAVAPGAAQASEPRITKSPKLEGTAEVGGTLRAVDADWRGEPEPVAEWRWVRCETPRPDLKTWRRHPGRLDHELRRDTRRRRAAGTGPAHRPQRGRLGLVAVELRRSGARGGPGPGAVPVPVAVPAAVAVARPGARCAACNSGAGRAAAGEADAAHDAPAPGDPDPRICNAARRADHAAERACAPRRAHQGALPRPRLPVAAGRERCRADAPAPLRALPAGGRAAADHRHAPGYIGKVTTIRIRRGAAPVRTDRCLYPNRKAVRCRG